MLKLREGCDEHGKRITGTVTDEIEKARSGGGERSDELREACLWTPASSTVTFVRNNCYCQLRRRF